MKYMNKLQKLYEKAVKERVSEKDLEPSPRRVNVRGTYYFAGTENMSHQDIQQKISRENVLDSKSTKYYARKNDREFFALFKGSLINDLKQSDKSWHISEALKRAVIGMPLDSSKTVGPQSVIYTKESKLKESHLQTGQTLEVAGETMVVAESVQKESLSSKAINIIKQTMKKYNIPKKYEKDIMRDVEDDYADSDINQLTASDVIEIIDAGGYEESTNKERFYFDFLNKDKGHKKDRKYFNTFEDAKKWVKQNIDNPTRDDYDQIQMESVSKEAALPKRKFQHPNGNTYEYELQKDGLDKKSADKFALDLEQYDRKKDTKIVKSGANYAVYAYKESKLKESHLQTGQTLEVAGETMVVAEVREENLLNKLYEKVVKEGALVNSADNDVLGGMLKMRRALEKEAPQAVNEFENIKRDYENKMNTLYKKHNL